MDGEEKGRGKGPGRSDVSSSRYAEDDGDDECNGHLGRWLQR